jgi:hypothetical protein
LPAGRAAAARPALPPAGPYAAGQAAALALALALAANGCSSLLPDARDDTQVSWRTFDEARDAIEAIEPFRTTRAELAAAGIDPARNASVTLLGYPDIVQRFASGSAVLPQQLDPGVYMCLASGKSCTGYAIAVKRIRRERIGNFWADSFGFRRETLITGWTFTATVLFVGDQAVFAVHGGQPNMRDTQVTRNPLGPLQGWGDAIRLR